jgi:hypothetical protein
MSQKATYGKQQLQNAPKKDKTVLLTTERIGAKSLKADKIDRVIDISGRAARAIDTYDAKRRLGGE